MGIKKGRIRSAVATLWTCSCCGRSFNSLPMNYAFSAPANWFAHPKQNELRAL